MKISKILLLFGFLQSFYFFCFCAVWRDPFNLCPKEKTAGSYKFRENIKLVGVINIGSDFGAILRNDICQEVVFLNDQIWGYAVKEITLDHVLLVQADNRLQQEHFESRLTDRIRH